MAEGESESETRKDFNREMNSYISSRKKKKISWRSIFGSRPRPQVELHPEVTAYGEQKKEVKDEKVQEAKEEPALEEEYKKELSRSEKGVLSRILSLFKSEEEYAEQKFDEGGKVVKTEIKEEDQKEFKEYEAEEMLGEKPLEEQRGLLSGLARFLGLQPAVPDYDEEVVGGAPPGESQIVEASKEEKGKEVKDDMKNIAKISTDILKKLDPKKLEEFKKTPDFIKFKEILKKHSMIK